MRLLGRSGLRVSPLCLGTMNFGETWDFMGTVAKEEAEAMFNLYCDLGGNYIDTANKYHEGQSEEWIGEFVAKRGNRDELVIATKYTAWMREGVPNLAGNHKKNLVQALDASLHRLQMTYVDILYVHFWEFTTFRFEDLMRALNEVVLSGKVLHLGISDCPAWIVASCNLIADQHGWEPFTVYQGRYHLGDRAMERDVIPMCTHYDIGLSPWGVLGQGKFTGKYKRGEEPVDVKRNITISDADYDIAEVVVSIAEEIGATPSQVTLAWMMKRVTSPIIGTRRLSQLEDNLCVFTVNLSEEHLQRLDAISSIDLGFPHSFLGTTSRYQDCVWLQRAGIIE